MVKQNQQIDSGRSAHAFTLIEMLVVCTIIMILIAILLPHLAKAREAARLAECAAHQAQLGKSNVQMMTDTFNQFSPIVDFLQAHQDGLTVDPADENPLVFAAASVGTQKDARLSYGLNGEFQAFGYGLQNVKLPDERALFYDGLSGPGTDTNGQTNTITQHNHKMSIVHDPAARGENGGIQSLSISGTSLSAHIGHGDPIGDAKTGFAGMAAYHMGEFDARHKLNDGLGNVLFVDGHTEAHPYMTASMFLVATQGATNGNGNGNGNGNN